MRVVVKNHALPVYKKNRIASLLCIFESTIKSTAVHSFFVTNESEINVSSPVDGMHFFYFARNKRGFFHEIGVILNYCKVCCFRELERSFNACYMI